jgi:hypothetical protein
LYVSNGVDAVSAVGRKSAGFIGFGLFRAQSGLFQGTPIRLELFPRWIYPVAPFGAQLPGYAALIAHYGLECPPPRRLTAIIAVEQAMEAAVPGGIW